METHTSDYYKDSANPSKTPASRFEFILGAFFLGLVLVLPSGITAWFDGLPWTGSAETLVPAVIIPFLVILGWRFLSLRFPIGFLGVLLFIKIALFLGSPAGGWLIKLHPNLTQEQSAIILPFQTAEGDTWVNTYETSWNENASGILRRPWTGKLHFPMDWVLYSYNPKCGVSTAACFFELSATIKIEGALLLPTGKKFALIGEGVQEGTLSAIHESGETFVLSPAKSFKEAAQKQYQLAKKGKWQISGKLLYKGPNWSLIPALVKANGEISSDLERGTLWQNEEGLTGSPSRIWIFKTLSLIADGGIVLFLLAWAGWVTRLLIEKQILNLPLAVFSISAVCLPLLMFPVYAYLLGMVGLDDPTTHSHLGFSIILAGIGFLIWTRWKNDLRNFQDVRIVSSVFLLFAPALLFFFAHKWWSFLGIWTIWGAGNDWTSYQFFARKIVVDGDWLLAGENYFYSHGVFVMQPLYRYFVGVYHWLFGQSSFVQHMADVWCIIGAFTLLASWAVKLRLSTLIVFITSFVYLMPTLIGGIRYHIGRGLIEHHAMIFMVLAVWFLYQAREGSFLKVVFAGIFGVIGYWLRQDHLVVTALLVFLIVEPTHGTTGEVWRTYWEQIRTYWKRGFTYVGIVGFGVFLLCFRNWWLGGEFGPVPSNYVGYVEPNLVDYFGKIKLMVTASPDEMPSLATFILLPGILFGLVALLWRPMYLRDYPMAIGLALIGLFLPYLFVLTPGYPPRYSIHLLPLALISFMIVLNSFCKDSSLVKRFSGTKF